jgi:methylmalonyl-CoA mutase C-terminal domain/subunit
VAGVAARLAGVNAHSPERIVLAKIGLDGHDRGVRVLARALRDAGMEVVYIGPWASPAQVVAAAVQEDVDVVGVSSLAYDHLLVPALVRDLRAAGYTGAVVVGGTIQSADVPALEAAGVARVFHPGEPLDEVIEALRDVAARAREAARAAG